MDNTIPPHPKIQRDDQGNLWLNFGEYGQQIDVACFSSDGTRLLTVREVGIAQVWNTISDQRIGEIRPDSPLAGSDHGPTTRPFEVFIEAASLSPDGTRALLGLNDGTAGLFDVASGDRLATLHDPDQPPASGWELVRAVAYAPDGARVAVGFHGRAVGVWDSSGSRCIAFLRDPLATRPLMLNDGPRPALVSTVAFSSDNRYLFAGYADGIVTIWDLTTMQAIFTATAHTERTIAVSTHGAVVRWATDGGSVWEAEPGQAARRVLAAQERWIEATFEPGGATLVARSQHEVQHWNMETGVVERCAVTGSFGRSFRARTLVYHSNGTHHVFPLSVHRLVLASADRDVEIQRANRIERVSFSPSGDLLVTEGQQNQVEVWSVPDGACLGAFPVAGGIGATAVSADGRLLAVGTLGQGGDGPIRPIAIWDIVEQRQLYQLLGHVHQVQSLAFSPDGRWLVSASLDRTVRLWTLDRDTAEPKETAQLAYGDLEFESLHVLSDGRILVFREDSLEIWRELRELLVRVPAPHPFDCRWQVTGDEQQILVTFGCSYCYAAAFVRDQGRRERWGQWVRVKENALELLRKQRRKPLDGQAIYLSSVTDPYQPIERKLGLTRTLLEELLTYHRVRLVVQTRSPLVTRDLDLLSRFTTVRVNMTVTTDDEAVRKVFEPGCASIERRLQAIAHVQAASIPACITLTPLLPVADPAGFAERLKATGVQRFVTQYLHAERGQFVAGTRAAAVALCRERGWDEAAYRRTMGVLRAGLPQLDEGREGFVPM